MKDALGDLLRLLKIYLMSGVIGVLYIAVFSVPIFLVLRWYRLPLVWSLIVPFFSGVIALGSFVDWFTGNRFAAFARAYDKNPNDPRVLNLLAELNKRWLRENAERVGNALGKYNEENEKQIRDFEQAIAEDKNRK